MGQDTAARPGGWNTDREHAQSCMSCCTGWNGLGTHGSKSRAKGWSSGASAGMVSCLALPDFSPVLLLSSDFFNCLRRKHFPWQDVRGFSHRVPAIYSRRSSYRPLMPQKDRHCSSSDNRRIVAVVFLNAVWQQELPGGSYQRRQETGRQGWAEMLTHLSGNGFQGRQSHTMPLLSGTTVPDASVKAYSAGGWAENRTGKVSSEEMLGDRVLHRE